MRRCVEEAAIIVTNDAEIKTSCIITLTSPVMRDNAAAEGGKKELSITITLIKLFLAFTRL